MICYFEGKPYIVESLMEEIGFSKVDIVVGVVTGIINTFIPYIIFWTWKISVDKLNIYWNSMEQLMKLNDAFCQNTCGLSGNGPYRK